MKMSLKLCKIMWLSQQRVSSRLHPTRKNKLSFFCSFQTSAKIRVEGNKNAEKATDNSKFTSPAKFSETSVYPTRLGLKQTRLEEERSKASNYVASFLMCCVCVFVVYAFFFSDYNLEIEEKLGEQLPGYTDYMKKADPKYEERLNKLRAQKG